MLSPLPRRNHEGARVVRFPSWRRPSPYPGGIGFRIRCFRGLLGVHCALRPACSLSPYGPFSRNASVASLPPQPFQVLPAGTTLAGRELHPLKGCAFARHTKMPALPGKRPSRACMENRSLEVSVPGPPVVPCATAGGRAPTVAGFHGKPLSRWERGFTFLQRVKCPCTAPARFWWRGTRKRYDHGNDATGSAEAGNGRDSIGPGTRSGPSFDDWGAESTRPPRRRRPGRTDGVGTSRDRRNEG